MTNSVQGFNDRNLNPIGRDGTEDEQEECYKCGKILDKDDIIKYGATWYCEECFEKRNKNEVW